MLRTPIPEPGALTLLEATRYLGLRSNTTVWRKLRAGRLAGFQNEKGEWFVRIADLDRLTRDRAVTDRVGMVDAAALLNVNRKTAYRWATEGKLRGKMNSDGVWSFARTDVDLFKRTCISLSGRYRSRSQG